MAERRRDVDGQGVCAAFGRTAHDGVGVPVAPDDLSAPREKA